MEHAAPPLNSRGSREPRAPVESSAPADGIGGRRRRVVAVSALLLVVACGGCVRRRMMVRTNPPGATVSIDNQVIGTTPAATSFVYYGTREFRVEKEGFRTETVRRRINPPWYQWPGLDFVTETLWPGEIRDERIIDVTLVPETQEPTDVVVGRADRLRAGASDVSSSVR